MFVRVFTLLVFSIGILLEAAPLQSFANQKCEEVIAHQAAAPDHPPKEEAPKKDEAQEAPVPPSETKEQIEHRLAQAQILSLKISSGRQIHMEIIPPLDPTKATFLLIPGVNRGWMKSDIGVKVLAATGQGVVDMNFSTQPLSVKDLPAGVTPAFKEKDLSLQDLAFEVEKVLEQLHKQGINNVIPVTLSYSGIISPYLKHLPLIIETVPMTATNATLDPSQVAAVQRMRSLEIFNPFFGPAITRTMIDSAYRNQWSVVVDQVTPKFDLPKDRREDLIDGYVAMSKAAEDAQWKPDELPGSTRRVFILGANDLPSLLENQLTTARQYLKKHPDGLVVIVKEAGHMVPEDQPTYYAGILSSVANGNFAHQSGVVMITPSTNSLTQVPIEKADELLGEIIKNFHQGAVK